MKLSDIQSYSSPDVNVQRLCHDSVICYRPQHWNDLTMCFDRNPPVNDSTVLCCAAAFTHDYLNTFTHDNVEGVHYSHGVRYEGFEKKINSGMFLYYKDRHFAFRNKSQVTSRDLQGVWTAFQQNLIILDHKVQSLRAFTSDNVKARFRALCCIDGALCVIEGADQMNYSQFIDALRHCGAQHAIYMDNGGGWDALWLRTAGGKLAGYGINNHPNNTNWLMFKL